MNTSHNWVTIAKDVNSKYLDPSLSSVVTHSNLQGLHKSFLRFQYKYIFSLCVIFTQHRASECLTYKWEISRIIFLFVWCRVYDDTCSRSLNRLFLMKSKLIGRNVELLQVIFIFSVTFFNHDNWWKFWLDKLFLY